MECSVKWTPLFLLFSRRSEAAAISRSHTSIWHAEISLICLHAVIFRTTPPSVSDALYRGQWLVWCLFLHNRKRRKTREETLPVFKTSFSLFDACCCHLVSLCWCSRGWGDLAENNSAPNLHSLWEKHKIKWHQKKYIPPNTNNICLVTFERTTMAG